MADFKSRDLFQQITDGLKGMDEKEKKDIQKKVRLLSFALTLPRAERMSSVQAIVNSSKYCWKESMADLFS